MPNHAKPAIFRTHPLAAALALAFSATAIAPHALAQQTAEAGKLQTITVTAERREENIKDVPSAVFQLSGERLDVINSSGQDVRMLSGRVPSLNIESSFGRAFPRFYIRGYGNTDFRSNASQPVSLVYDDVVQENPILKGFPVFDLAAVEVLTGPQGTLFGRNTPAGVVKFDSVKPSKKQSGYGSISYGTYGTVNLEGAGNVQLGDDWSARISAQVQHRDDWVKNTIATAPTQNFEGYDDRAIRLQALYAPTRDFSALFNLHNRTLEGSARLFRANIIQKGSNELVAGFDAASISTDGKNGQTLENTGASAKLSWTLGAMKLYSITGYETVHAYSRGDIDGGYGAAFLGAGTFGPGPIPFPSETAGGIHDHRQLSQELRLESNTAGPLAWQAGVYFFNEKYAIDSFDYNTLGGGAQSGLSTSQQTNNAWAVFGSVKYAVSKDLSLRTGLRYTVDKKDFSTTAIQGAVNTTNGLSASTDDKNTSWDVSGTYALTPALNAYARVATGFRGSSIQAASAFGGQTQAGPETNTSFEAGIKGDLWDKRARVSAGVFRYDVKNQQLTAVGGASNATRLLNAAKVSGQGVEFNLDAYLTDTLLVTLGGSINDTQIKDPSLYLPKCGSGLCTMTDPAVTVGAATLYSIDGNPLPQAPKYTMSLTARYGIPAGPGAEYFVYTDWVYRSKVNFFLYESLEFTGKSLLEGGLRVGYLWGNGKYEAAAFGRNITNQVRVVGGIDFNNLTGFINDPRTYGVQFKMTF